MSRVRRKPPALLSNKRSGRGRGLTVKASQSRRVPSAPSGLRAHSRRIWRGFWKSPVSEAVDYDADYEALRYWIYAVDEREPLISQFGGAERVIMPGARHTKDNPHLAKPTFVQAKPWWSQSDE